VLKGSSLATDVAKSWCYKKIRAIRRNVPLQTAIRRLGTALSLATNRKQYWLPPVPYLMQGMDAVRMAQQAQAA